MDSHLKMYHLLSHTFRDSYIHVSYDFFYYHSEDLYLKEEDLLYSLVIKVQAPLEQNTCFRKVIEVLFLIFNYFNNETQKVI